MEIEKNFVVHRDKKILGTIILGIILTGIFYFTRKFTLPLILICTGIFFLYFGGRNIHLKHYYATKFSVTLGLLLILSGIIVFIAEMII